MEGYIDAASLRAFCRDAFVATGVPAADAAIMAQILVEADLKGVDTHGTAKLAGFISLLRTGDLNPNATLKVSRDTPTTAVINGDRCASGLAAWRAMEMAIKKARNSALGAVAVRNVGRCGALSTFTSLALEHDMIGFMTAQGHTVVPPYGGKSRLMNTSPWSFAIPAGEYPPIVLDMSSTTAAAGKINLAAKEKKKIPFGWLLDGDGKPTDDPGLFETGILTWIGEAKGYGLAVVDQVLAGILGGASFLGLAPKPGDDVIGRGHFIMAIRIDAFMDVADFRNEVDGLIRRLKASERIDGVDEILMPGERANRSKQERLAQGIPLRPVIRRDLEALAQELGLQLKV